MAGATTSEVGVVAASDQWEVEYSRFFSFPCPSSYSFYSLELRLLPRSKTRSGGTWLRTISTAAVCLAKPPNDASHILTVSVNGEIYEEHFTSNLNISWPQASCASDCPTRGSRVLFFSFKSISGQIQKFALRFPTCLEVQMFLYIVKESSKSIIEIGDGDLVCENSVSYGISASKCKHHLIPRVNVVSSDSESLPRLTYGDDKTLCTQQQELASNIDTIFLGLPPSFTDMMNACSTETEKDQTKVTETGMGSTSQTEVCVTDSLPNVSFTELMGAVEEPISDVLLNSDIEKYMSDASFHDMLARIEGVISELGGDMSL